MAETETSPVTNWRHRAANAEAVEWDGSREAFAALTGWGAEPMEGAIPGNPVLRVWGARGYCGAFLGDWLVRDGAGATRYTPAAFGEAFETRPEPDTAELLMEQAQEQLDWARRELDAMADTVRESRREAAAAARLERDRIRALAVTHGALCVCRCGLEDMPDPKPGHPRMFAELLREPPPPGAEIGASLRETLSAGVVIGPPDLNNGRPSVWSGACAPGGMVCAVLNPGNPDGICGMPVESEPCNRHEGQTDVTGEPLTHFFHCWRFPDHHRCAVALIERQSEENDELLVRAASLERAARKAPEEPKSAPEGEGDSGCLRSHRRDGCSTPAR